MSHPLGGPIGPVDRDRLGRALLALVEQNETSAARARAVMAEVEGDDDGLKRLTNVAVSTLYAVLVKGFGTEGARTCCNDLISTAQLDQDFNEWRKDL